MDLCIRHECEWIGTVPDRSGHQIETLGNGECREKLHIPSKGHDTHLREHDSGRDGKGGACEVSTCLIPQTDASTCDGMASIPSNAQVCQGTMVSIGIDHAKEAAGH